MAKRKTPVSPDATSGRGVTPPGLLSGAPAYLRDRTPSTPPLKRAQAAAPRETRNAATQPGATPVSGYQPGRPDPRLLSAAERKRSAITKRK